MWAPCLASYHACCACGLCAPSASGISHHSAGIAGCGLFSPYISLHWLLREAQAPPLKKIPCDIWHVSLENGNNYVSYGYRCEGTMLRNKESNRVLLDPYAKVLRNLSSDYSGSPSNCLGCLQKVPSFDWSGDVRLCLPTENLVVYRLNVGKFTQDISCRLPEDIAGTFCGLVEKVHHFKNLGVNAILLEPIFPFDERKGPYFPYNFFVPLSMYGPKHEGLSAINSMKEMVRTLHTNGIEVLLEVTFAHTAEGSKSQAISFQGIDNLSYYVVDGGSGSGANNALNCNSPTVQKMIIDSLRHWVVEFHIDGFCFVNATYFVECASKHHSSRPPLVELIAYDPVLSNTKIIADCWSPLDMSYHEINFPHWKRWAEMNSRYCKDVRNFLRGEGLLSNLATRLCGSGDVFSDSRGPAFSFNFIAKNFGLPLVDLVSFSRNGLSSEFSWNCGEEGPTNDSAVLEMRLKQIRNFLLLLFVSLGVPVLNMGDECGQSTGGSTLYSDRYPFNWDYLRTDFGLQIAQFIAFLSSLRRRRSDLIQRKAFHKVENIEWHGHDQSEPKWDDPSRKFLTLTLKAEKDEKQAISDKGDMFIVMNASDVKSTVVLPQVSKGYTWFLLVDTALTFPGFFSSGDDRDCHQFSGLDAYKLKPQSCALFEAKISSN
uniref:Isoamylase 2, chloroplastic n=1 Tax=Anthurium amnicola TaxID=1678845 RepID=A0A1D1YGB7_9ARAE